MTETSEDKLIRILTRESFETVDDWIRIVLSRPFNEKLTTSMIYKSTGWKREEYHTEVRRRAANRR